MQLREEITTPPKVLLASSGAAGEAGYRLCLAASRSFAAVPAWLAGAGMRDGAAASVTATSKATGPDPLSGEGGPVAVDVGGIHRSHLTRCVGNGMHLASVGLLAGAVFEAWLCHDGALPSASSDLILSSSSCF